MIKQFESLKGDHSFQHIIWRDIVLGDECVPFEAFGYGKISIHVDGLFSGAAQMQILGEIIPGKFDPLDDVAGYHLLFTMSDIKTTGDVVMRIMPELTGGDELTKISVGLLATR